MRCLIAKPVGSQSNKAWMLFDATTKTFVAKMYENAIAKGMDAVEVYIQPFKAFDPPNMLRFNRVPQAMAYLESHPEELISGKSIG